MRVVFIVPHLSQPRFHRRVQAFLSNGYSVTVYGFDRGFYSQNQFPVEAEVVSLGKLSSGNYINRIPKIFNAIALIRRSEKNKTKKPILIFAFGLDCAGIALSVRSRTTPLAYEIGDVRNTRPFSSPLSFVLMTLERVVLAVSDVLVLTSAGFLRSQALPYRDFQEKAVVIENKLSSQVLSAFQRPSCRLCPCDGGKISIGFVGLLRYPRTFFPMLEFIAENSSTFILHVFGDGPLRQDVERFSAKYDNIHYHGAFSYPDDLNEIYNKIDLSWVVYDNVDLNVRLALPNKLYESIYFGVPLVVADKTYLSDIVSSNDLGFVVEPGNNLIDKALETITCDKIRYYERNLLAQPIEACIEDLDNTVENIFDIIKMHRRINT